MKRAQRLRPGTWRQAMVTFAAVLPVSLVVNVAVAPLLSSWPRLVVITTNAVLLVAAVNWFLLPALTWLTRGWATPRQLSADCAGPTPDRVSASPGTDQP